MLRKLSIRNYAIIDQLELNFSEKLTVITGETGAGKSIAIEALSLVLGERADASVLFDKETKCIVEATFSSAGNHLADFFTENDLDFEEQLILRREISAAGKSRAFINDTPVNLSILKLLGDQLVDMHNQHESRELSTSRFQLTLLDSLAKQETVVREFSERFSRFQLDEKRRNMLRDQHVRETKELDYLNFQLSELTAASLKENEQEQLEQELKQLENAGEISRSLSNAALVLKESENSVKDQLKEAAALVSSIRKFYQPAEELLRRIESSRIEIEDIADEMENHQNQLSHDPDKLEENNQRLDIIYRLEKKHHVNTVAQLLQIADDLHRNIQSISIHNDELEILEKKLTTAQLELTESAKKISAERKKQIPFIVKAVNKMLKSAGMPNAEISIDHSPLKNEEMNEHGLDRFRFLFAPNQGSEFQEIRKIASGGELSRLMLCIKSLVAASAELPTLIFDEIDTGISGETAVKVSQILKQLAVSHQVICITHLPQIAAKGDFHYFVYKENAGGRTFTRVRQLDRQEKIKAIAQMIAGEKLTAASLESARELLN